LIVAMDSHRSYLTISQRRKLVAAVPAARQRVAVAALKRHVIF